MNFVNYLKSGETISVHGKGRTTGAFFFGEDGEIFVYNRHIGKSNAYEPGLNEHFLEMLAEGFIISLGMTLEDFKKVQN